MLFIINKLTKSSTLAFILLLVLFGTQSTAQEDPPKQQELGIFEHLDEYIPDDLTFVDQDYDTVNLKEAIDKPTVLVLVYYECPGICSPLLEGVAEVVSRTELELNKDYQVFTVSFNPAETPRLAKDKKKNYAKLVKNKDVSQGWSYFVGDSASIDKLLKSVGFKVKKVGKDWIHPTALIVLSPEGKITRYLHGLNFLPFDLKMAVVEAQKGKSGPTINKVLRYCFSYDPEGKKYVFNITKISGTIILTLAVILLLVLIFKKGKKQTKEF
ncbi:MAG: SCO family protein [Bacteroidota bacterium]|nr:SCO family protein [Bacteroidota bacterium]